jgi:hypothetical protein
LAAQRLGDLAKSLNLDVDFEQIPQDGHIDLNRDGLVVICGPRMSAEVADVLRSDPAIRFVKRGSVWVLKDLTTGAVYRSGQDERPARPYDVGYLGRVKRPDKQGCVLILTGIHPPGSLGVVHLLSDDLEGLFGVNGEDEFSAIVGVDYDATTHEPTNVKLLAPAYRHEEDCP